MGLGIRSMKRKRVRKDREKLAAIFSREVLTSNEVEPAPNSWNQLFLLSFH